MTFDLTYLLVALQILAVIAVVREATKINAKNLTEREANLSA